MERIFFKSKIHRACVTDAHLDYEGSLGIDPDLMEAADILPYEKVDVVNLSTGDRFTTYAIRGQRGSGEITLNGGAARLGHVGDLVIILTYAHLKESELPHHKVKVVLVDENNRIKKISEDTVK